MLLRGQDIWRSYHIQENSMQVILLETFNKLGKAGEIVNVKDGYANNFLLPQKKAIIANKKNKENLESKMSQINENNEKKVKEVPKTLIEAIQLAKKSKLLKEIFNKEVLEHYIHAAEWEQKEYDSSINDWQLRRYFERG